jgi:type IV pilus assembly protein PilY1
MKPLFSMQRILAIAAFAAALVSTTGAHAQLADIADVPLANSPSTSVLPNLMYVLDDSGSMNWNYMPDQVLRNSAGRTFYHCKRCVSSTVSSVSNSQERITTAANHNGIVGSTVVFTGAGTVPAPLVANTVYYIVTVVSNTQFQVSATQGGAVIDITGTNTGAGMVICGGPGGDDASAVPRTGFPCANDQTNPLTIPSNTSPTPWVPTYRDPPYAAPAFNKIWYNPDITYSAAVDSTGTSYGNAPPTSAANDFYDAGAPGGTPNTNLTAAFKELVYCNVASPSATDLNDVTKCRFNGRHNTSTTYVGAGATPYFLYFVPSVTTTTGENSAYPWRGFNIRVVHPSSVAHYYNLTAHEYCSDTNLANCVLANAAGNAPDGTNILPAPVRWCKSQTDAVSTTPISGTSGSPATARCRKKFDRTTYPFPRFGRFKRVDITSANAPFVKGPNSTRSDCASTTQCTYTEEIQNFANWWTYYSNRMSLMKTATGKAFLSIDDRFRIGFITINPNNPVAAAKFLAVGKFDATQRASFYTKLYAQATNGGTPLREALSRIGRYYGGLNAGINTGMIPAAVNDPVQYSCQTNYALLTTDGYWNGATGVNLGGSAVGNQDNSNTAFTKRSDGAYDGGLAASVDTLGDVAAYYYKTDLRTAGTTAPNNVPTNNKDTAAHQHMVTFTLGLGLEGFMDYIPDYETSLTGDFAKIKAGVTGCSWTAGTCDWPVPVANEPSTLDDLWHAAVNGRGQYFSAGDPNSLALGLQTALAKLKVATAAAAASATSSPNITQTSNFIFSSTFRTGAWDGEIVAQKIDLTTGAVLPAVIWSAQASLDSRSSGNSDTRTIFTIDEAGGGKRKNFKYVSLSSTASGAILPEQSYFANKCGGLAQCTGLTTTQQAIVNDGVNLVDYLRGQRQYESFTAPETSAPFRFREHVLGDPVNATPAYVAEPSLRFTDAVTPTYDTFKSTWATRRPLLFIGANDGMLHAFNGDTGIEEWAYVPRITMPNMHKLATANWGATHRFSVDGSPQIMDAYFGGAWHTVLVAGLNGGGRGYYALDVTDPDNTKVLWEICADPTVCAISDSDIGYTFGNPIIAKRAFDGKWVAFVTSGLNNVLPGTGVGYLFTIDLATGAILSKVSTGYGSTTTPAGLNRIAGFADDFSFDNTSKFIYGGDLGGNVWKFDTSVATPTVMKLAVLKDATGKVQPITTRPELAAINNFPVVYIGTGRYIGEDDLQDPATLTPPQTYAYAQSMYAIKDRGVSYPNFRAGSVVANTITDQGTTRTTSNNQVNWATEDGWYVDFNPAGASPGERVNLDPQLIQGTLIVVTNVPNNSACTVGGDSWIYFFDYKSGTFVSSSAGNVAGTKFTGQITVGTVVVRLPSGVFKGIATGATGDKTTFSPPISVGGLPARRISWREIFAR